MTSSHCASIWRDNNCYGPVIPEYFSQVTFLEYALDGFTNTIQYKATTRF